MVPNADEHLASALKRATRISPSSRLKNEAARARNKAARQMDGVCVSDRSEANFQPCEVPQREAKYNSQMQMYVP